MILRLAGEALRDYGQGFSVETAVNGKEALEILRSRPVDLVVTDLKMPVMDGYELLTHMSRNHRRIPVIVMTGFGSAEIARQLKERGVRHYIEKPFEITELRERISSVFTDRSKGYIHGFTLANFLQAVEVEQKTTTLRIKSKGRVGYLHIDGGNLIDADTEAHQGEAAAIEILCWDDPEIEMQTIQRRRPAIRSSLMQILLEASKRQDESIPPSMESPLDKAMRMAQGLHIKSAQKVLAPFLKKNPRNPQGWLWYSRLVTTLKSVEVSLSNAAKLAPKDPEIAREREKLARAKAAIREEPIRRCPFCWTPAEQKATQCPNCRAHLFIHDRLFYLPRDADRGILESAIERYTKVIGRERNVNAYYYLSLAHLNLAHWEEALNLFHKTVNLAPDKPVFSDQLRILLKHMASVEPVHEPEPEPMRPAPEAREKKRILVVEDSPTTRKVISITLGQKGYEIIEARDGLEALSKLNDNKPDLILLDIVLPKMDGYKILEIIKGNSVFKHIPVIMLTSKDGMISKWKGKLAGSTAYLTKPFDPKKLVTTIEKYL